VKKHALIVGVEDYRDRMISHLLFARADALALGEQLRSRCGFDQVVVLAGQAGEAVPDLHNVLGALDDLAGDLHDDDLFLFFFAGHGVEIGGRPYLLTREARLNYPGIGALDLELLKQAFARMPARWRVLLLDACRNSPDAGRGDSSNLMAHSLARDVQAVLRAQPRAAITTALLSACRPGQRAYEWPAKGHGVFTHFLLSGLSGAAWSGTTLEFKALAGYVQREVARWSSATAAPQPQEPWYQEEGLAAPILLAGGQGPGVAAPPPGAPATSARAGRIVILEEPALHVETMPSGATVSMDGRRVGKAPVKLTLASGVYRIRAEKEGYRPWERRIRFDATGDAQLRIELEERPRLVEAFFPMTTAEAREVQRAAAEALGLPLNAELDLGRGVKLKLALIPAGTFLMGSPEDEKEREDNEGPQHEVTICRPFYMGTYQVTQEQYKAVTGEAPSKFKGKTNPVECVSWDDAVAFCEAVSQKTGKTVRLPTEAEWEYACRAGTATPFYFGETISTDQANYDGNFTYGRGRKGKYREKTTPVGSFPPNAWGLYDMHGNVLDWCADSWHNSYDGAPVDGTAWEGADTARVLRGGGWYNNPRDCRSADRHGAAPVNRYRTIGFRVVVDLVL